MLVSPCRLRIELRTVPSHTEYRYAVANDRRVVVEPRTRKAIKIIDWRRLQLHLDPRGQSPAGIFSACKCRNDVSAYVEAQALRAGLLRVGWVR